MQNCLTDYSVFPSLSDILVWGSPSQRYQTQKDENWCHDFSSVVYQTNLRTSRRKFHVWIEKKAFLPPPRFPGAPSPMENPSRAYAAALFRRVRKCGDRGTVFNYRIKDNRRKIWFGEKHCVKDYFLDCYSEIKCPPKVCYWNSLEIKW